MYTVHENRGVGWFIKDPQGYFVGFGSDEINAREIADHINRLVAAMGRINGLKQTLPMSAASIKGFTEKHLDTPEKATAFLQRAGILDDKGDLAEPYRE